MSAIRKHNTNNPKNYTCVFQYGNRNSKTYDSQQK